jgi:ribonuclease HIII
VVELGAIAADVRRLRAAWTNGSDSDIDRGLLSLERSFLTGEKFRKVGDEHLVSDALRLLEKCYGEKGDPRLDGATSHLASLRSIHDKLYGILDSSIQLDVLLFEDLDSAWPGMDHRIGCAFDEDAKKRLDQLRSDGNPAERLDNFIRCYLGLLKERGLADISRLIEPLVNLALDGYAHRSRHAVYGLFDFRGEGEVLGLDIEPVASGSGSIRTISRVGDELDRAAKDALVCAQKIWPAAASLDYTWAIERSDVAFGGTSLGLALTMGIGAAAQGFGIDAYTAFTGGVEWNTRQVRSVDKLATKIEAAAHGGFRRVFVPRENRDEVGEVVGILMIPVSSVEEAWAQIRDRAYPAHGTQLERLANARIREAEIELHQLGVKMVGRNTRQPKCVRLVFTDHRDDVPIDVFFSKRLAISIGGRDSGAKRIVADICGRVFGTRPGQETRQVRYDRYMVVDADEQRRVERYLFGRKDTLREEETNCIYRAKVVQAFQTVLVRQFESGTLTIQGVGPLYDEIGGQVRAILDVADSAQSNAPRAKVDYQPSAVEGIDLGKKWIGTDEAGKGDYFGPLVVAAVLVDESTVAALEAIGVKDSKALSDKRNRELAVKIRGVSGERAQVVVIPPERYNSLYDQFKSEGKNLNTLLAWAHARSLEDILQKFPQERIAVLVDKFADEHYIEEKLLAEGRQTRLELIQIPRAEANMAVAAASILARATFLEWLERLSKKYGVTVPKGASNPRIIDVAGEIVSRHGDAELGRVAKLHFKTTERVISSP